MRKPNCRIANVGVSLVSDYSKVALLPSAQYKWLFLFPWSENRHMNPLPQLCRALRYRGLMTLNFMKITVIGNYVFNTLFSLNQGTGMYVYIETSSPRQPGDTARLESPWMRGPQCMTFFYHMYGATMSRVVIYIKSQATNRLKTVWLRSQDQGDHWIQERISINETSSYQVSREY